MEPPYIDSVDGKPVAGDPLYGFVPAECRPRQDGWTEERQRTFLQTMSETGCVSDACQAVGLSPRSAYRLRAHPKGRLFAHAWNQAMRIATHRLVAIAFERAVHGSVDQVWRDGVLVAERRVPSNRLLMMLLTKLDPQRFGTFDGVADPVMFAHETFPDMLNSLCEADVPVEPIGATPRLTEPDPNRDP